jgi:hypothetical protein
LTHWGWGQILRLLGAIYDDRENAMTTNEQIEQAMSNAIEHTLEAALSSALTDDAPPLLAQAMR